MSKVSPELSKVYAELDNLFRVRAQELGRAGLRLHMCSFIGQDPCSLFSITQLGKWNLKLFVFKRILLYDRLRFFSTQGFYPAKSL